MTARAGALLAAIAVATACSGSSGAEVTPSAPAATSQVTSSPTRPPTAASRSTAPHGGRAAPLPRSVPVRLQIAAIGVNSALMSLGLKADRTIEVPPGGFPAGWYTGAPTPGELGPAIIAGHIDLSGPGVFFNLHRLKAGDKLTITRQDGSKPVFRVTRVAQFSKDKFPTALVYGNIDRAGLRLITCGGAFNSQAGHYEDNVIAFADLVGSPQ